MRKSMFPIFNTFPQRPGCYIVRAANGRALYVGQSTNIWRRWAKDGHTYREIIESYFSDAKFEFIFCDDKETRIKKEAQLIKELKPALNDRGYWEVRRELGIDKPPRRWKSKGLLNPLPKKPSRYLLTSDD